MMYFPAHNLAVLAVPRTGSTSVETAFAGTYDPTDYIYQGAQSVIDTYGADISIVATIRHPLEWLRSWYSHLSSGKIAGWDTTHMTFTRFLQKYVRGEFLWPTPFQTQADQMANNAGVAVTTFPFGSATTMGRYLSHKLGMQPPAIPHLNRSTPRHATASIALIQEVTSMTAADMTLYSQSLRDVTKQAGFPASVAWPPVPV